MHSACGRYVIVFNGEIYNHLELRRLLENSGEAPEGGWRGTSDTETLITALRAWGPTRALQATRGMFAFALWDNASRRVTFARDRLGEKPLYVSRLRNGIAFSSELKALEGLQGFTNEIDRGSLDFYLRHAYIRAPNSIFKGTTKLLPGTYLTISENDIANLARSGDFLANHRQTYWSLAESALEGIRDPFTGSEEEAIDELGRVLGKAVERQMISDVPLGAFLSGGIDSTAIVAMMQAGSSTKVRTFTVGFSEEHFDESRFASEVAKHLGTEHTTVVLSADDALAKVDEIPSIWDEPFADASQLPTILVSEVARAHVTVALSGDGGDELFGGYERYRLATSGWQRFGRVPRSVRGVAARGVRVFSPASWDTLLRAVPGIPKGLTGDRIHKLSGILAAEDLFGFYDGFLSSWKAPGALLLGENPPSELHWSGNRLLPSHVESLMLLDALDYMPDDVLVKVDRASMSRSLESRAPMLDVDVVDLAWRFPLSMKRRGDVGKWVLRKLVHRHVPQEIVERPKMGFGVPIDAWLRGPLKGWAQAHLTDDTLVSAGIDPKPVTAAWNAHQAGTENHQYFLWNVLNYMKWRGHRGL